MALADAQSLAVGKEHQFIEPSHVLMAMLDQEGSSTINLLKSAGADTNQLRQELDSALKRIPTVSGNQGNIHISKNLERLLNISDKLAQQRNDQYISSELFLLAAMSDKNELSDLLKNAGLTKAALEQAIEKIRGGESVNDPNAEENRQALEKYTIDLTARAEQENSIR